MKLKPKIFDGILTFTRWSIDNPHNGMDYLEVNIYDGEFLVDPGRRAISQRRA